MWPVLALNRLLRCLNVCFDLDAGRFIGFDVIIRGSIAPIVILGSRGGLEISCVSAASIAFLHGTSVQTCTLSPVIVRRGSERANIRLRDVALVHG